MFHFFTEKKKKYFQCTLVYISRCHNESYRSEDRRRTSPLLINHNIIYTGKVLIHVLNNKLHPTKHPVRKICEFHKIRITQNTVTNLSLHGHKTELNLKTQAKFRPLMPTTSEKLYLCLASASHR